MKKTWEGINTLFNQNRKTKMASKHQLPNSSGTTQNLPQMANIMNFASVGPKLANNIPLSSKDF